jgi:ABC-type transporter lipoprotein component MlaA
LKPAAKRYNVVVPDIVQTMIDNAFTNLRMPSRFVNKVLQWKLLDATKEMGRFFINSTLGVGGLFDVARQEMGLATPLTIVLTRHGHKVALGTLVSTLSRWVQSRSVFYRVRPNMFGFLSQRRGARGGRSP